MARKPTNFSVESNADQLVKELRGAKLSSTQLAALWRVHRGVVKLKLDRPPQPIGTPYPELLRGQVSVQPADLGKLTENLLANQAVRSWRIFPIGIVNPERYVVEIDLGTRA